MLVVGWGSTRGAIEEALLRVQRDGHKVSYICLRFLQPLEPGLRDIFSRFKKVMTIEINYSDDFRDPDIPHGNRRFSQLARLLRSHTLVDVDCWSRVPGTPLQPGQIEQALRERLEEVQ
jgi:2-oxoglutarate ferredoxin oxidoreductase subunit alpha